jgi:hypothetical protein
MRGARKGMALEIPLFSNQGHLPTLNEMKIENDVAKSLGLTEHVGYRLYRWSDVIPAKLVGLQDVRGLPRSGYAEYARAIRDNNGLVQR